MSEDDANFNKPPDVQNMYHKHITRNKIYRSNHRLKLDVRICKALNNCYSKKVIRCFSACVFLKISKH